MVTDETVKSLIQNAVRSWHKAPSVSQCFNLPSSIVYHMTMNPLSSEVYQKLVHSCKYFFKRNPIIVVARLDDGRKITLCKNVGQNQKRWLYIDIKTITSKIWITNELFISKTSIPNIAAVLSPRIYHRCENAHLTLWYCAISMNDFKALGPAFQNIIIHHVKITDNNGNIAVLENILESLQNVKELQYWCVGENTSVTTETMKNLLKLKNLNSLQNLSLFGIPEIAAVGDIANFIKAYKNTKIWIQYWSLSEQHKAQLDSFIDDIISLRICNCVIRYFGQDDKKLKIMKDYNGV